MKVKFFVSLFLSISSAFMCCAQGTTQFCAHTKTLNYCDQSNTAQIQLNPSGGTGVYDYQWSHNSGLQSNIANDLIDDLYSITVTDTEGSFAVCLIDISSPSSIDIIDLDYENPSCGEKNGSIHIIVENPSADNMYSIDGGISFHTSSSFLELQVGTYDIVVRDINDCIDTTQIILLQENPFTAIANNIDCADDQVTIDLELNPSNDSYSYNWEGPNGFVSSSQDIVNGPLGIYVVTITNSESCEVITGFVKEDCCNSSQFCNAEINNNNCIQDHNGSIRVTPIGGVGPYIFSWSHDNSLNSSAVSGLKNGTYTVTVTDAVLCRAICTYVIQDIDVTEVVSIQNTLTDCEQSLYDVIINASNSNNNCKLEFSIDQGNSYQTINTFNDVVPGKYQVFIRDCHGCVIQEDVEIDHIPVEFNFGTSCNSDGSINIDLEPEGLPPFSIQWFGPNGFNSDDEDIVNASPGTYTVNISDANNCTNFTSVTRRPCCEVDLFCEANLIGPICDEDNSGIISVSPSGGETPYNYFWAHDNTLNSAVATNLLSGSYTLTVVDANGCQSLCDFELESEKDICCELSVVCPSSIGPFASIEEVPIIPAEFLDDLPELNGITDWAIFESLGGSISLDFPPCGDVVISAFENVSGNGCLDNPYVIKRTFAIADEETETFCSQNITVDPIDCDAVGSIGDFVWHDLNGNGIQEINEEGIQNIAVNLYTENGFLIQSTFTNSSGNYLFENISIGNYYLVFVIPESYESTLPNALNPDLNSDVDDTFGDGSTRLLEVVGTDRIDIDLGLYMCIPVGDRIWFDINGNNQYDDSENGINGISIDIFKQNQSGTFDFYESLTSGINTSGSASPSDDGYFKACVSPGTYYLQFDMPPFGLVSAIPNIGSEETDSDVTDINGPQTTHSFTVMSGEEKCDIGAGYYAMASLGDLVWIDTNGNGMQDIGEEGLDGVTVCLIDGYTDQVIATQVTANGGQYLFEYLSPGDYYLQFKAPEGYELTTANNAEQEMNSDVNHENGDNTTRMYTLDSGMTLMSIDAGFLPLSNTASLSGCVFDDRNFNGVFNLDEFGINDVEVFLIDAESDSIVSSTVTDILGKYFFEEIMPNDYYLLFDPPGIYTATELTIQDPMSTDLNNVNGENTTSVFSLEAGSNLNSILAGFTINVTVAVNWISFSGVNDNNKNILNWTVADEVNVSHYELERSIDGNSFSIIGKQIATDEIGVKNYSFVDYNIEDGVNNYYRIKQIDLEGKSNYSSIISIKSEIKKLEMNVFPNPTADLINLELSLASQEEVKIKFLDQIGNEIILDGFKNGILSSGKNIFYYNLSELSSGVYFVVLDYGDGKSTQKIIKI